MLYCRSGEIERTPCELGRVQTASRLQEVAGASECPTCPRANIAPNSFWVQADALPARIADLSIAACELRNADLSSAECGPFHADCGCFRRSVTNP